MRPSLCVSSTGNIVKGTNIRLSVSDFVPGLGADFCQILCLDSVRIFVSIAKMVERREKNNSIRPTSRISAAALCCVLYSTGSLGVPSITMSPKINLCGVYQQCPSSRGCVIAAQCLCLLPGNSSCSAEPGSGSRTLVLCVPLSPCIRRCLGGHISMHCAVHSLCCCCPHAAADGACNRRVQCADPWPVAASHVQLWPATRCSAVACRPTSSRLAVQPATPCRLPRCPRFEPAGCCCTLTGL